MAVVCGDRPSASRHWFGDGGATTGRARVVEPPPHARGPLDRCGLEAEPEGTTPARAGTTGPDQRFRQARWWFFLTSGDPGKRCENVLFSAIESLLFLDGGAVDSKVRCFAAWTCGRWSRIDLPGPWIASSASPIGACATSPPQAWRSRIERSGKLGAVTASEGPGCCRAAIPPPMTRTRCTFRSALRYGLPVDGGDGRAPDAGNPCRRTRSRRARCRHTRATSIADCGYSDLAQTATPFP